MGVENGEDWRIKIGDGAGTEAFNAIGGEVSFSWARSSSDIDKSSKDNSVYATGTYGRQQLTISVNGKTTLPDTGLERVNTIQKSATPEANVRIVKGTIIKFEGLMAVGNFNGEFPDQGPSTYSFTLKPAAVPTTDNLAATV
jgi:hypothetical protein